MVLVAIALQAAFRSFSVLRDRECHVITGLPSDSTVASAALINHDGGSRSERELIAICRRFTQIGNGAVKSKSGAAPQDVTVLQQASTVLILGYGVAKQNAGLELTAARDDELDFCPRHSRRSLTPIRGKNCPARITSQRRHAKHTLLAAAGNRNKAITLIALANAPMSRSRPQSLAYS